MKNKNELIESTMKEVYEILKKHKDLVNPLEYEDLLQEIMLELIIDINENININLNNYIELKTLKIIKSKYQEIIIRKNIEENQNITAYKKEINPEEIIIKQSMNEEIRNIIENSNLTRKELEVLLAEYPLYDNIDITEEMIQKKYKNTIENVKLKALNKLRMNRQIDNCAIYMDNPQKAMETINTHRSKKRKKMKIIRAI